MNNKLTEIVLVADRSGSMDSIRTDAQGGINEFIKSQKRVPGEANFTLVEFDHEYNFVHQGVNIQDVPEYELRPRGMTALLDAVGRTISETGIRLSKMNEDDRPGLVVFVIVTDGHENGSTEYTREQIRDMIKEQEEKYNWQFTYLGADASAFDEGGSIGLNTNFVAQYNPNNVDKAYTATSHKIGRMRAQCASGIKCVNEYTEQERKMMVEN